MTDRRSFLASLAVTPAVVRAGIVPQPQAVAGAAEPWDFSWIDRLNGTYRQVFDCGEVGDDPLRVVQNYLNGFRDVMGLEHPIVNAVVAIAGRSFPINASDTLWARFPIAERWKIPAGADGKRVTANPWASTAAELKSRGAFFWQCNNALNRIIGWFAADTGRPAAEVREEVVAGLLPGVTIVPAHTMLLGMVQHRGCTYEKL